MPMNHNSMAQKPINRFVYRAEAAPATLLQYLPAIRVLADSEKEALGFLPEAAYRDAITQKRLFAMVARDSNAAQVIGFVLFSGVFPNARIQQIAVDPAHRRSGVASALVSALVSH